VRSLYVCYFGLRQPLVQTQVLPYLRELTRGGIDVLLLTFEAEPNKTWTAEAIAEWRDKLRADGIRWFSSTYHKRPSLPATVFDIFAGALRAARLVRKHRVDVIHARSHVPAAMGVLARKLAGAKVIFDIRGLMADEYVDAGHWSKSGLKYRLTKRVERSLYRAADAHVVLTDRARAELFGVETGKPLEVIPCCTSPSRFADVSAETRDAVRRELGASNRTVIVYAGSLGGAYLTRELAELFAAAKQRDPSVFALVLTQSGRDTIEGELATAGFTAGDYHIGFVSPDALPRHLAAGDVAVAMLQPTYSKIAMSPTKFAEYLSAGLPVIAPRGIGDLDVQVEQERVGVLLDGFDASSFAAAFDRVQQLRADPGLRERCIAVARRLYDLETVGGHRYRRLYTRLGSNRPLRVLALATYPFDAAATRYRILQFVKPLAARGVKVTFSPFLDAKLFAALYNPRKLLLHLPRIAVRMAARLWDVVRAARADVIWVQREAALFGPPLVEWLMTRVLRRPMVLDVDDATHVAYVSPVYGRLATFLKYPQKTHSLVDWSATVVAGNPMIAGYAAGRGARTEVLPTIVDVRVVKPAARRNAGVPVVGWMGTRGTHHLLETIFPALARAGREHRFRVKVVGAGVDAIAIPNVEVEAKPWRHSDEVADLQSFDAGVYPLFDDERNAGKSGFKAIQYMAAGIPFVMSPIGVGATIGIPGRTHFLARTEDEWVDALVQLLGDPELRAAMGDAGRAYAEEHYSVERQADELAMILRKAADR
jgi:glycosyltransferase involved in cell wall biosynthesis